MKKKLKFIRNNWIMIWLVIAAMSLSTVITYAAYIRINIVKRVVSTTEGAGNLFSSNYMNTNTSSIMTTSNASYTEENNNAVVTLDIYNYDTPKKVPFFNELSRLDYKVEVKLVKNSSGAELSDEDKNMISGNNLVYSFNGNELNSSNQYTVRLDAESFDNTTAASKQYKLMFDKSELSKDNAPGFMMYIKAIPAPETDLKALQGYVGVKMRSYIPSGWYGELIETGSIEEYDGYNYEIKGSGVGKLTVTYNADKLTPNKYIFDDDSITFVVGENEVQGGTNETNYITYSTDEADGFKTGNFTLLLDSTANDVKSRFIVQFYKTDTDADYEYEVMKNKWITSIYTQKVSAD